MYQAWVKRFLDIVLSLIACVVLAIPMGIIALWVKADSPGPVFFRQRWVGAHKVHFNILKFRTMRGDTPHDVPTHLLKNADSYITRSGAFLRRTSLDELAQVNGRDELPIDVKARYDGQYAAHVTFGMDLSIFLRTIGYVFARRGVVEGGTGALEADKRDRKPGQDAE